MTTLANTLGAQSGAILTSRPSVDEPSRTTRASRMPSRSIVSSVVRGVQAGLRRQPGGVADLVARPAGNHGHAGRLVAAPERLALANHPQPRAGGDRAAAAVGGGDLDQVVAGLRGQDPLGGRAGGGDGDLALERDLLVAGAAGVRAIAGLVPAAVLDLADEAQGRGVGDADAGRIDRDQVDRERHADRLHVLLR